MKLLYRLLFTTMLCDLATVAMGQVAPRLNSFINAFSNIRTQLPIEKLYLQTDKPNYLQGDTIWFKAYLLDADYLTPAVRSGLLYVELDDMDNTSVMRTLFAVSGGLGWGQIALDEKDIPAGSYTLRAYTNWIRNFGEDYVFSKKIYVASAGSRSELVVAGFTQTGNNIAADILLSDEANKPLRLQDMQLKGLAGKHTLFRSKMATGIDGRLNLNFNVPEKTAANNLAIEAKKVIKGEATNALTIPVTINRPENTDLQFMPEGGKLVAGIGSKVGFKAIGEDGKGAQVSGKIYNSKQREVASFTSVHNGIGAFGLMPQAGEIYSARLTLPNGTTKNYPLPVVNANGTSLQISKAGADSIEVKVAANTATPGNYYLVGQARGVVCYAAHLKLKSGISVTTMPQSLFPTGIARFTLLNDANQPLNERIIFINHNDDLQINIKSGQQVYAQHDSIAMQIFVTDKSGKPVHGSFSMAVTDDTQVKNDSQGSSIMNNLLLTS
ncbi:MAG: hypothetical protein ABIN13_03555, partial [Mucilaginibacter sp.]